MTKALKADNIGSWQLTDRRQSSDGLVPQHCPTSADYLVKVAAEQQQAFMWLLWELTTYSHVSALWVNLEGAGKGHMLSLVNHSITSQSGHP